jgi:hypothetical protein
LYLTWVKLKEARGDSDIVIVDAKAERMTGSRPAVQYSIAHGRDYIDAIWARAFQGARLLCVDGKGRLKLGFVAWQHLGLS